VVALFRRRQTRDTPELDRGESVGVPAGATAGDRRAFEALYLAHFGAVYGSSAELILLANPEPGSGWASVAARNREAPRCCRSDRPRPESLDSTDRNSPAVSELVRTVRSGAWYRGSPLVQL
jgi:hypothetical protein